MPSKARLLAKSMIESPILSEITTNPTVTPTTITTAVNDVATGNFASIDLLPSTGNDVGDQAFVQSTNRLYIWSGSGWYNIALINTTPTWDSNGQPASSYELDADSPQTATTITLAASDPEGISIQYSYVTGGSMDSIATVSQDSSVFTITPKTEAQTPDGGTGSITFRATDGVNILPYVSSFTLNFISIIENSRHTTLLATATGTSDNNNIADSSSNNRSITVNGDAYAGTFSPYRSRGYSTYFEDTAANVLYASPSSDFAFGTGAFTISVWVKLLHQYLGTIFDTNDGSNPGVLIAVNNITFYTYSNTWLSSTSTSSQDVWQHFCWTRDGSGNNKVFVNGTQATTFTDSTNYTSQNFKMGEEQNGTNDLKAYVKDLHIVKGYAYEPDSTYADGAAEPTTGTVFLGCSLPYHGDKSSSPKTLTVANSGISIVNDTPHDYTEYSATDHGGSLVINSTSAWVQSTVTAPSTGSFAIECWVYWDEFPNTSNGNQQSIISFKGSNNYDGVWLMYKNPISEGFAVYANDSWFMTQSSSPLKAKVWYHAAITFDGTNLRLFVNGSLIDTKAFSTDLTNADLRIGNDGWWRMGLGKVSDVRYTRGSAVYTAEFTPPTAPLSSSGSELHIKGTDASIIDKSQGDNLKLFGNTTGSTTQVKFAGSKSMYFDGTGDYISIPSDDSVFSKDYTIEFWMYPTQDTNLLMPFSKGVGLQFYHQSGNIGAAMSVSNSGTYFYNGNFGSITTNAWSHISLVRDSSANTYKFYINGTLEDTLSSSSNINAGSADWIIGGYLGASYNFQGYIQDLRVTEGLARYTATDETSNIPSAPLEG